MQLPDNRNFSYMPVMVYLHGGGFTSGSGGTDLYGPDYLIEEYLVIVTLNYRLGLLGKAKHCFSVYIFQKPDTIFTIFFNA